MKKQSPTSVPKFYGKGSVGTKGQIVIPAEARKAMGLKPGDNVMMISGPPHHRKMLTLIPEEEFSQFLKFFEDHIIELKKTINQ